MEKTSPRKSTWLWLLGAVLVAFVPYREFFSAEIPTARDLLFYFYPLKNHLAEAIRSGQVPWIDKFRWGGVPLLSAPGAAAFYPANLLFVLLPLGTAMKAWMLFHLALGMGGFFQLSRRLGLEAPLAALSSLFFGLSGVNISVVPFVVTQSSLAWLPWLAVVLIDLLKKPGIGSSLRVGMIAGLVVLTAVPEFVFFGAVMGSLVILLWRRIDPSVPEEPPGLPVTATDVKLLALALAVAALLSAPAMVASMTTAFYSVRGPGGGMSLTAAGMGALPLYRLPEFFVDNWTTDWLQSGRVGDVLDYPYLPSLSPGLCGWAAILMGLTFGRKSVLLPLLLALTGLALALGPVSPVWTTIYSALKPLQSLRYPEKNAILTGFGLAWLAAIGLYELQKRLRERNLLVLAPAMALVFLFERDGMSRGLLMMQPGSILKTPPAILEKLAPARVSAMAPRIYHRDSSHPVPVYDLGDLLKANQVSQRSAAPEFASLFGYGYTFAPDYDLSLTVEAFEWEKLLSMKASPNNPVFGRIIRMAGAQGMIASRPASPGFFVPELLPLKDPLSPVRFATRAVSEANPRLLFQRFLSDGPDVNAAYLVAQTSQDISVPEGRILSLQDRADGLRIEVDAPGPGRSLLTLYRLLPTVENAELDGERLTVLPMSFGFAAAWIPPGRHSLVFRPETLWIKIGVILSLVTAGTVALLWNREGKGSTQRNS